MTTEVGAAPRSWWITVPTCLRLTSPNKSRNWGAKSRLTKKARADARLCWLAAGSPFAAGKVRVSVTLRRRRPMDEGNVWAALKPHLDGILVGALVPDDKPEWVQLGSITQDTGPKIRAWDEQVTFHVEEIE